MSHEVRVEHVERKHTAQVRFRAREDEAAAKFGEVFGEIAGYLGRTGTTFDTPFARYLSAGEIFEVDAGFLVPGPVAGEGRVVAGELPAGEALVTTHIGPYQTLNEAYGDIQTWAKEHGRELDEPMWECYFSGPETPPAETRTDVYWILKPQA